MPTVRIEVDGDTVLAREFEVKSVRAGAKAFEITRTWGQALRTRVLAHASGRPGPRHRTGDYKRSWTVQTYTRGGTFVADIGTNAPQGRRLEFGFTGTDALGRHYNQPPYPHARPALDEIAGPFEAALIAAIVGDI